MGVKHLTAREADILIQHGYLTLEKVEGQQVLIPTDKAREEAVLRGVDLDADEG